MISRLWLVTTSILLALAFLLPATAQEKKATNDTKKSPAVPKKLDTTESKSSTTSKKPLTPGKKPNSTPSKSTEKSKSVTKREVGAEEEAQPGVIPLDYLFGAAKEGIFQLEESFTDPSKFNKQANARNAKVVAVMAQLITEHTEDAPFKKMSPTIRDSVLKVAKAQTVADAKKAIEELKMSTQQMPTAKPEFAWAELIDVPTIMAEVKIQHGKLSKFTETGKAEGDALRQIIILTSLGHALQKIHPKLNDKKDVETWNENATIFTNAFSDMRTFLLHNQNETMKFSLTKANKSCAACHEKFQKK